ncbi:MAG: NAD-dependent epimerase/dehydratase family protein, partial [Syntrophaceae bacterium]|nr:NAD-dependent epimerase/dehydratase family protein [Syntrophaceae bacterium]
MKVFITGGTGFVGTFLAGRLIKEGHDVSILTPNPDSSETRLPKVSYIAGNPTIKGRWQESVGKHDAIINLAGASIFSRWTPAQKKIL